MVGHSRSGKTSFMAGMYKYLGESKEGYGIKSLRSEQKANLKRMAEQLSRGRYPNGTDVQQVYNFSLTVNGDDIIPFNWLDYRGGILLSDDPDESDMTNFLKAVELADALVVFLDGEKLADKTGKWRMEYDILLSCIERSLDVNHNSWFPINFVITKCDLLPSDTTFHGLDQFYLLFEQISQSDKVGAMLLQSSINSESYVYPFLTLAYCIFGGTPIYVNKRVQAINEAQNRANRHNPETLIGGIFALLEHGASRAARALDPSWGWDSELDLAENAENEVQYETAKLEQLKLIADDLKEKLQSWASDNIIHYF